MNTTHRPPQVKFGSDVQHVRTFFYTYEDNPDCPVIAGVTFGTGCDITVYTREQAEEFAAAFTSLAAQFTRLDAGEPVPA
jgi:hypothetical protein